MAEVNHKYALSAEDKVSVRAFAPFEVADVMSLWSERYDLETADKGPESSWCTCRPEYLSQTCEGLGPPFRYGTETARDFGWRVAAAIHHLIKEI